MKLIPCLHAFTNLQVFKCLPYLETVSGYFLTCMFFEGKDLDQYFHCVLLQYQENCWVYHRNSMNTCWFVNYQDLLGLSSALSISHYIRSLSLLAVKSAFDCLFTWSRPSIIGVFFPQICTALWGFFFPLATLSWIASPGSCPILLFWCPWYSPAELCWW